MIGRMYLVLALLGLPIALWPDIGRGQAAHSGHPMAHTPPAASPYQGQESRAIKALDPAEVEQLLRGEGLGLAKAAELNHYPGPRHVLDAAGELGLSPAQLAASQSAFALMRERAIAIGTTLLARERELDAGFASGRIDGETLGRLVTEIARLRGTLRTAHLQAHLEMKRILTAAQVNAYDRLRGYTAMAGAAGPHAHEPAGRMP